MSNSIVQGPCRSIKALATFSTRHLAQNLQQVQYTSKLAPTRRDNPAINIVLSVFVCAARCPKIPYSNFSCPKGKTGRSAASDTPCKGMVSTLRLVTQMLWPQHTAGTALNCGKGMWSQ